MTTLINQKEIITLTKSIVGRMVSDRNIIGNAKIFLSAYMITYYETSVFEQLGSAEIKLHEAAITMLVTFHRIL